MQKLTLYPNSSLVHVPLQLCCIAEKSKIPEFVPFLQEIGRSDIASKKKIVKFFETLALFPDHIRRNEQKYEKMKGTSEIYELKPTRQVRFFLHFMTLTNPCVSRMDISKK